MDTPVLVGGTFSNVDALTLESAVPLTSHPAWDALSEMEQVYLDKRLKRALEVIRRDAAARGPAVLGAPDDPLSSMILETLAENAGAKPDVVEAASDHREAKFDKGDVIGWAKGMMAAWFKGGLKKPEWIAAPNQVTVLDDSCRLAILGDWGSGLYGAPVMAQVIEKQEFHALVHLGDVYYTGSVKATKERFLKYWPNVAGAVSRACNSNHDMYAGGKGYFGHTLPTFGQSSSVFALRTNHWLLVGLDTAYDEGALAGDQVAWLQGLLATHPNLRVLLFSHHQGASLYGGSLNDSMLDSLEPAFATGRVEAWYWGHEHRCVLFDREPNLGYWGRCVGHSGFPEFRLNNYGKVTARTPTKHDQVWLRVAAQGGAQAGHVLDGRNPFISDKPDAYGPHGYATLDLDGPALIERVHDAGGDIIASVKRTPEGKTVLE